MNVKEEYNKIIDEVIGNIELISLAGISMFPAPPVGKSVSVSAQPCDKCGLHKNRSKVIKGEGNRKARLVFVGGGPGSSDDLTGRPFSGPDGALLTKIISSMGFNRNDVYVCYALRCRLPVDAGALTEEIASCKPFLEKEISAISPAVVVALGEIATRALLGPRELKDIRGRIHTQGGMKVMPTYEPAMLLENPVLKKDVWKDMLKVMDELKKNF